MRQVLLSYFDKKLGVYSTPHAVHDVEDDVIIEEIRRMCANPKLPKVYLEYDLYRIGDFDDKTGEIKVCEKPVFLVSLNDFRSLASEDVEDFESN